MTAVGGLVFLGFQAYEFTEFYVLGVTLDGTCVRIRSTSVSAISVRGKPRR